MLDRRQEAEIQNLDASQYESDKKLHEILKQYSLVFRKDFPAGLPPQRAVEHIIELQEGAKPPHRPLFQLFSAEIVATKEYILELLRKGKIRPSRSPFGEPLFLLNKKGK